jgi:DNA-binding MarR family transcriptional regulator
MNEHSLTDRQLAAWTSYQRMRVRLADRLNRELTRATGLSEADYEILDALTRTPAESVRALALRCGLEWEKSRLSHQLRRMEQRGLLTRETCAEDNRGAIVRLTDTGRHLATQARLIHTQALHHHLFDILTPAQLETLTTISTTILTHLDQCENGSEHNHS